jgi:hypothetical protein
MEAASTAKPVTYRRRRPELTPCYSIIQNNLNTFISDRDREGRPLPNYVINVYCYYTPPRSLQNISNQLSKVRNHHENLLLIADAANSY